MSGKATSNSIASVLNGEEAAQIAEMKSILEAKSDYIIPTYERDLLRFLRFRKNNVEEAVEAVLKFWRVLEKVRQYKAIMMPSPENLAAASRCFVLRGRDKNGCQIVLQNLGSWEPTKQMQIETFLVNFPIICTILDRQLTQTNGVVFVLDFVGYGSKHVLNSTPFQMKQIVEFLNSTPVLIKGIHFVNNPAIFGAVWSFMKVFMKDKIKKRAYFHGHKFMQTLHEHIDPKILPKCYGGPLDDDNFAEEGFDELLLAESQYFKGKLHQFLKFPFIISQNIYQELIIDFLDETKYGYFK